MQASFRAAEIIGTIIVVTSCCQKLWLRSRDAVELPGCRRAAWELRAILKYGAESDPQDWLNRWGQQRLQRCLYDTICTWLTVIESILETERTTDPAEALNRPISCLNRQPAAALISQTSFKGPSGSIIQPTTEVAEPESARNFRQLCCGNWPLASDGGNSV